MAHIVEDRVLESTTTIGIGPIALAGAVTAFRRFSAVCAIGDTMPYFIEAIDALGQPTGDYEYGIGTYSAANQLTRTTVMGSSNAGGAVNFAAGAKNVGLAMLSVNSGVPTGAIFDFPATTAPRGYVEVDGSLKSRATYPLLYAFAVASGNMAATDGAWTEGQFSPGDGATTFRVPDYRGRFRRGWDHGRGVDAARAIGSSQADALQGHAHANVSNSSGGATAINSIQSSVTNTGGAGTSPLVGTSVGSVTTDAGYGTARVASETRPANVSVLTCIKY